MATGHRLRRAIGTQSDSARRGRKRSRVFWLVLRSGSWGVYPSGPRLGAKTDVPSGALVERLKKASRDQISWSRVAANLEDVLATDDAFRVLTNFLLKS